MRACFEDCVSAPRVSPRAKWATATSPHPLKFRCVNVSTTVRSFQVPQAEARPPPIQNGRESSMQPPGGCKQCD